jgi:hypothetical protein
MQDVTVNGTEPVGEGNEIVKLHTSPECPLPSPVVTMGRRNTDSIIYYISRKEVQGWETGEVPGLRSKFSGSVLHL